jgi:hypothetical protein
MTLQNLNPIRTIELIGWDFDEFEARSQTFDREKLLRAGDVVLRRQSDPSFSALCEEQSRTLRELLEVQQLRHDLHEEMLGLDWFLGVVDLRQLLTFQRRLSFDSTLVDTAVPRQGDWGDLIDIAFAPQTPIDCDLVHDTHAKTIILRSSNPNLQLRVTQDPSTPVAVYTGSPFFEVAQYAGRWFLRDGYHRAYNVLRSGIFQLPAVIVRARTLEELGAVQPRFFSEKTLLSQHPPFVRDFLDDRLTIQYDRPPTIKTLRITMDESVVYPQPVRISGEQP